MSLDNIAVEDHFHIESLEDFTAALTTSGFKPVVVAGLPAWRGPIHPAFVSLTEAQTMDIVIQRGWPFQPPALLVDGLDTNHSHPGRVRLPVARRRPQSGMDHRRGILRTHRTVVRERE